MKRVIVISGIPGSGKSTIGHAVAKELGLEMLDKDDMLEVLFESEGIGDAEWRMRLSRAADDELRKAALRSDGAVITSWWRHPKSTSDSGTPVEWIPLLGDGIEVHCECSPELAAARFKSRTRHKGHLDHSKTYSQLLDSFLLHAAHGPLMTGPVIKVNTEHPLNLKLLLNEINSVLKTGGGHFE